MREVKVTNMTSLFRKEMLLYSFFDIRLKRPIRAAAMLYFVLLFALIGAPILIFAWPPNVYKLAFAFGIPFAGASAMSKPIWNGKSFISFFKTQVRYLRRPKTLYDWRGRPKQTRYAVNSNITVSRHEDYNKLYKIAKEEEERLLYE